MIKSPISPIAVTAMGIPSPNIARHLNVSLNPPFEKASNVPTKLPPSIIE